MPRTLKEWALFTGMCAVLFAGFAAYMTLMPSGHVDTQEVTQPLPAPESPKPPAPPPLTDKEKIAALRKEAHKLGMRWRVWCVWWEEGRDSFQAVAWKGTGPEPDVYTQDMWIMDGPTQADAAYALYKSIAGKPTHPKNLEMYKIPEYDRKKYCPPEITGQWAATINSKMKAKVPVPFLCVGLRSRR